MEGPFAGRQALVIGGSGGVGAALSLRLAGLGAEVTVHGAHSRERLDRTVGTIIAAGGKAGGVLLPLDQGAAALRLLEQAPRADLLVCAWGPFSRRPLQECTVEDWEFLTFANLAIPGILVSAVLRDMMERAWGRILLFGGTNTDAVRGFSSTAAYSAAKTALSVLAKSAARTGSPYGVTCNVLCPGFVDTEYLDDAARVYARERAPGGKLLSAAAVADAAAGLLANGDINGAVVPVDGGFSF